MKCGTAHSGRLLALVALLLLTVPSASHCETSPLPNVTGPRLYVLDCGTLVNYRPADYNLKRMPDEKKTTGTVESRLKVEELLRRTKGQLWIGHSMDFFRTVRKSPAWYD